MDGTGKLFRDFVDALPAEFEALTVSYPPDRCMPYSSLLPMVLDSCPKDEPFVILAESFSTPLAILCGARNLPNLSGVVICAGFATSPVKGWRRWVCGLLTPLFFRIPLPEIAVRRWLLGEDAPLSLLDSARVTISSVHPKVLVKRLGAVLACNTLDALSRVSVPMLYIQAAKDRIVGVRCLEEMLQIRPDLKVERIDGPHLLVQRRPQRVAETAARFILTVCVTPQP